MPVIRSVTFSCRLPRFGLAVQRLQYESYRRRVRYRQTGHQPRHHQRHQKTVLAMTVPDRAAELVLLEGVGWWIPSVHSARRAVVVPAFAAE